MKLFLLLLSFLTSRILVAQQSPAIQKIPIDSIAEKKIIIKGYPDFLAADGKNMWVLNENRVEKFSPDKNEPILSITVPGACGSMIMAYNSLWVTSCSDHTIYRIHHTSGKILAKIDCGVADKEGELSLAAGAGSIWVLSDKNGVLSRIEAKSNKVTATIAVLPNSYCAVFGFNAVWITNTQNNSVQRINPKNNKVTATINVGRYPRFLTAGEGSVWTLNQKDGNVSRIDPIINKVTATIPTEVPGTGGDIDCGNHFIWVRSTYNRLLQTIDPATNQVKNIYYPVAGSGAVRVSKNHIWVTAHDKNTLWLLKK